MSGKKQPFSDNDVAAKVPNMSMGDFQNVVVHFKRALALLQNAEAYQARKNE